MTADMSESGTTYHREGGAEGDINFARVQHSATQVLVYLRFEQLSVPKQYGGFDYILEGNNGVQRQISVDTRKGKPQGDVTIPGRTASGCTARPPTGSTTRATPCRCG